MGGPSICLRYFSLCAYHYYFYFVETEYTLTYENNYYPNQKFCNEKDEHIIQDWYFERSHPTIL